MVAFVISIITMIGLSFAYLPVATACSPSIEYEVETVRHAVPTAVVFRLTPERYRPSSVTVTLDGNRVPGELLFASSGLLRFIPDTPLVLGESYEVSHYDTFSVVIVEDMRTAQVLEFDPSVQEREKSTNSCVTGDCACCWAAWPTEYDYLPGLKVTIQSSVPSLATVDLFTEEGILIGSTTSLIDGTEEVAGPNWTLDSSVCALVTVSDIDNNILTQKRRCIEPSEIRDDVERRDADSPETIKNCVDAPKNGSDPNWDRNQHLSKASTCSTVPLSGPIPSSRWLFVVFMLVNIIRLRRT